MRIPSVSFALAAGLVAGCVGYGSDEASETTAIAARVSGAIFTTLVDGSRVDANIYQSKSDVYLDGGPGNGAPQKAAGLPDGDYYFQVTDPSGKVLLSSDAISCRRVQVSAGIIVQAYAAGGCGHMMGTDQDHGAATVQLMPYDDTPNPGGEYKVWMTPVDDFDITKGKYGFIESDSKTDNYKVRAPEVAPPPPPCGCCGNGTVDEGEQCDDGNTTDGDGCSSTCMTETPPPPTPCCGDGHVDTGEQCDDGNTVDGDGCSSTCTTEAPPPPPPCSGTCGDGMVDEGEQCDDGNMVDGDGCSSTCQTEAPCPPTP